MKSAEIKLHFKKCLTRRRLRGGRESIRCAKFADFRAGRLDSEARLQILFTVSRSDSGRNDLWPLG